jgi:hypothetical protein
VYSLLKIKPICGGGGGGGNNSTSNMTWEKLNETTFNKTL